MMSHIRYSHTLILLNDLPQRFSDSQHKVSCVVTIETSYHKAKSYKWSSFVCPLLTNYMTKVSVNSCTKTKQQTYNIRYHGNSDESSFLSHQAKQNLKKSQILPDLFFQTNHYVVN